LPPLNLLAIAGGRGQDAGMAQPHAAPDPQENPYQSPLGDGPEEAKKRRFPSIGFLLALAIVLLATLATGFLILLLEMGGFGW